MERNLPPALCRQAEEQPVQAAGEIPSGGREPAAEGLRLRGLRHRPGGDGGGVDRPAGRGPETGLAVGVRGHGREMSIIEEYERNLQFEQQCISSVVEGMEETHIICPICHTNNLTINNYFISCPCGLYINTKNQNITPDVLRLLLESRVSEHMEDCLHNPVFSVAPNTDSSPNLMISCKVCDYLSIVL
ncbi:RPA-interacting protein isoform X2 [Sebastes fasciatus]|uniref:RPA-interacting protein isoform X2 n=1 Tax=Sebastes fasciatus TaxID=394691 RepID=UPI003D9E6353